jgi:hypothetical protein
MVTYMSGSFLGFDVYQFVFRMRMPEKKIAQPGIKHHAEGAIELIGDGF